MILNSQPYKLVVEYHRRLFHRQTNIMFVNNSNNTEELKHIN